MRYITPEIERLFAEEERMAFIAGPRQVGKTTLAQHLLQKVGARANYFTWDNDTHRKAIVRNPDSFWVAVPGTNNKTRVALDEIHKYPRWKRFLKGLFDLHKRELELVVTGSGRLDIFQKGGDSLFGRYALYRLHPFSLGEMLREDRVTVMPPATFWDTALQQPLQGEDSKALSTLERFSGFPEPLFAGSDQRHRRWKREHHRLVIREELRDLTRIREIGLIETLLILLPERVGSPLSINSLREDLNVAFDTVQNWIRSLERLYYIFEMRPYATRTGRMLRREAKVYFYDFTEVEEPGARFENIVALHLLKLVNAWNDWGFGNFDLHYVRTKEKKEVDFLIMEDRKPHALIETKLSGDSFDPSLIYFQERLKPRHTLQVVRKASRIRREQNRWLVPAAQRLAWI